MGEWSSKKGNVSVQVTGDLELGMEFVAAAERHYQAWDNIYQGVSVWHRAKWVDTMDGRRVFIKARYVSGRGQVLVYAPEEPQPLPDERPLDVPFATPEVRYKPYFCAYDSDHNIQGFYICDKDFDLNGRVTAITRFGDKGGRRFSLLGGDAGAGRGYFDVRQDGYQNLFTADFTATIEPGKGTSGSSYDSDNYLFLGPEYPDQGDDEGGLRGWPPQYYWDGTTVTEYFLTGPEGVAQPEGEWIAEIYCWEPDHKILPTPFYHIYGGGNPTFSWDYGHRHLTGEIPLAGLYHNSWYDQEHYGMVYTVATMDDYIEQPNSHGWELWGYDAGYHWNTGRDYYYHWGASYLERIDRYLIKEHRAANTGSVVVRVNGEDYVIYENVSPGYAIWPEVEMKMVYAGPVGPGGTYPAGWLHIPEGAEWPPYEEELQPANPSDPHYIGRAGYEDHRPYLGFTMLVDAQPVYVPYSPLLEIDERVVGRRAHPRLGGWIQPHDGAHDGANIETDIQTTYVHPINGKTYPDRKDVMNNAVSYHDTPFRGLGNLPAVETLTDAEENLNKAPWYCSAEDNGLGLSGEPQENEDGDPLPGGTESGNFKYFYMGEEKQLFMYSFLVYKVPGEETVYEGKTFIDEPDKAETIKLVYGIVRAGEGWKEKQGHVMHEYEIEPFETWQTAKHNTGRELPGSENTGTGYVSFEIGLAECIEVHYLGEDLAIAHQRDR